MLFRDFYRTSGRDDETCVTYLHTHELLDDDAAPYYWCAFLNDDRECAVFTASIRDEYGEVGRRNCTGEAYTTFRCSNYRCRTYRLARVNSPLFTYIDIRNRLGSRLLLL